MLISIFVIGAIFVLVACANSPKSNMDRDDSSNVKVRTESIVKYLTFEQLLKSATDIVKRKCIDIIQNETYI